MSSKVAGNTRDTVMMIRLITTVIDPEAQSVDTREVSTTTQDVSASEADSLLGSLGLTLISWHTLERFVERSPGNRLSVRHGNTLYAFTAVPANER